MGYRGWSMDLAAVTSGTALARAGHRRDRHRPARRLEVDRDAMRRDLARRQAGYGRSPRQKIEKDDIEILGGMRHGRTLGGPRRLIVRNRDHANWGAAMSAWPVTEEELARGRRAPLRAGRRCRGPGHADLAGVLKYGLDDVRNVLERASARETSARVAAGGMAKALLALLGIAVRGQVLAGRRRRGGAATHGLRRRTSTARAESEVGCLDAGAEARDDRGDRRRPADRDTLGGMVEVRAFGCPPGLGSHTEPRLRLDARLAARGGRRSRR